MIKFFRNIRRRMLGENRFSKYLLYAVGEIILVVIGILIALEVNNRNNEAQVRRAEAKYLTEMAKNLKSDLQDVYFNIDFNQARLRSSQAVLDFLESDLPFSDTMETHFGSLLYTTRSVVNFSTFEALTSRGIEIIANDSLRTLITDLYSFHYHNVIDFEKQDDHVLQYTVVMPTVLEHVRVRPVPEGKAGLQLGRPIDLPMLRESEGFKNALVMNIDLRIYMIDNYKHLEEKILECQKAIKKELKKKAT